jgi:cation:H+ antiporter
MIWIVFLVLAAGLVYAGSRLTIYADRLAGEFNLARSWVGLLAVGLVTSLPEIATTISAIAKVEAPDMAIGNVFGSCLFNLFILAICDAAFRKGGLLKLAGAKRVLSAKFDILILVVAMLGLLFPLLPRLGPFHFGWGAPAVILVGIAAFTITYRVEHGEDEDGRLTVETPVQNALPKFLAASAAVVVCGYALAITGDRIAAQTGLTHTFVGSLFLALATSLPELIVSITAIRMGAYDLMLGNILGSNLWNVMIYGLSDFVYTDDVLRVPTNLGWGQVVTGVTVILTTLVVIAGLRAKPAEGKRVAVGWESYVIGAAYFACMAALFFGRGAL